MLHVVLVSLNNLILNCMGQEWPGLRIGTQKKYTLFF